MDEGENGGEREIGERLREKGKEGKRGRIREKERS